MNYKITIKTLDSKNFQLEIPSDNTISQLKQLIEETANIPIIEQRLIFCGQVLKDTNKVSDYDCNDKVIHLAKRPPPPPPSSDQQQQSDTHSSETSTDNNSAESNTQTDNGGATTHVLYNRVTIQPGSDISSRDFLNNLFTGIASTVTASLAALQDSTNQPISAFTVSPDSNSNFITINTTPQFLQNILDNNQQRTNISGSTTSAPENTVMMEIDIDTDSDNDRENRRNTSLPTTSSSNHTSNTQSSSTGSQSFPRIDMSEIRRLFDPDRVKIIEADIEKMRAQRPTPPPYYSDLYIASVSKKRRHLYQKAPKQIPILEPSTPDAINSILSTSIKESKLPTYSETETTIRNISNDPSITSSYEEYLKSSIAERVESDSDYKRGKFRKIDKYLNNDK